MTTAEFVTNEHINEIKVAHENFRKKLESVAVPADCILNADHPAEREVIELWADDPIKRKSDLKKMGAI